MAAFGELLDIMDNLREKCPWDQKQTIESLRHLSLEEVHELSDAILQHNMDEVKKELGDLFLHVLFYAKIASESSDFDIFQVMNSLKEKLIRRHPHIYGNVSLHSADDVQYQWEKIKQEEKKHQKNPSYLDGVPSSLPSLIKAYRIQEKAAQTGFDWDNATDVWSKVKEEWLEFTRETNPDLKAEEFGDLLFSLVNYARFTKINPDDALESANRKFMRRFHFMEHEATQLGTTLDQMTLTEMETLWQKAKNLEKK
jgi:XTP/dITP diphosphohydrolase